MQARCAHEASALGKLRTAPTDPWLSFLREHRLGPTGEPEMLANGGGQQGSMRRDRTRSQPDATLFLVFSSCLSHRHPVCYYIIRVGVCFTRLTFLRIAFAAAASGGRTSRALK